MIIEYTASVFTPAGWRGVTIRAIAERVSAGMARVTAVTAIDGEDPRPGMSRTGARRQQFNGAGVAAREIGVRKRLSACNITGEA
jgi:peptide deformylase